MLGVIFGVLISIRINNFYITYGYNKNSIPGAASTNGTNLRTAPSIGKPYQHQRQSDERMIKIGALSTALIYFQPR